MGLGGAGPIPWSSIDRYAARYGLDSLHELERLHRLLRVLDQVYLEHQSEQAKAPK